MAWNNGQPIEHASGKNDPAHNYYVTNGQQDGWNVHIHHYQDGHTEIVRVSQIATAADPAPAPVAAPMAMSGSPQPTSNGGASAPSNGSWAGGHALLTNEVDGNPRKGQQYYVEAGTHDGQTGEWHIYKNDKEFVSTGPAHPWPMTPQPYGHGFVPGPAPAASGQGQGVTMTIPHDNGKQHPSGGLMGQSEGTFHSGGSGGLTGEVTGSFSGSGGGTINPAPTSNGGVSAPSNGDGGTPTLNVHLTPETGNAYTVVGGDNLWNIAKAHNMSLAQLEELNPQIKHPELIEPGDKINLGGSPAHEVGSVVTPTAPGVSFPTGSSYQSTEQSKPPVAHADKVAGGWGTGTTPADPASQVIALEEPSTDPLKIKDDKSGHSEHIA